MTRHIWKYRINFGEVTTLSIPDSGTFKRFDRDPNHNRYNVYYEVDVVPEGESVPTSEVKFSIVGTGHPIPKDGVYGGSVREDYFMWHLYVVYPEVR